MTEAPTTGIATPARVRELAGPRQTRLVWENDSALTYEIGADPERFFIKWAPVGSVLDLGAEAARMDWAGRFTRVPRVLEVGRDDRGTWLVTTALPGEMAITDRWKADPRTAVAAIGAGLRALHDVLPVARCSFSWNAQERLADARKRAASGLVRTSDWDEAHRALGVGGMLERAARIPPTERLVVCHGDACAPNTLIGDDGRWTGHVDLGSLGIADRWADLAVATWSTQWNYGPGWEGVLLDAYGVAPDPGRTAYYRLLYALGP